MGCRVGKKRKTTIEREFRSRPMSYRALQATADALLEHREFSYWPPHIVSKQETRRRRAVERLLAQLDYVVESLLDEVAVGVNAPRSKAAGAIDRREVGADFPEGGKPSPIL